MKKYQAGASVAMYFYAKLDRAPESVEVFYQDSALMACNEIKGPGAIMCLNYKTKKDEIVNVKIGLSYTSIENAKVNLESEAKDLAFDEAMKATTDKWNESLSRILVSEVRKIAKSNSIPGCIMHYWVEGLPAMSTELILKMTVPLVRYL